MFVVGSGLAVNIQGTLLLKLPENWLSTLYALGRYPEWAM
jgi:hypothetical protein